jgi:2-oxoglutarate ferredoxin oxidoreductase subunit beta
MVALGANASFVGRTVDIFVKEQRDLLRAAADHRGASFVEIYQNCNIFNDGASTRSRRRRPATSA